MNPIVIRCILQNHMCSWCPELEEEPINETEEEQESRLEYLENILNFIQL